MFDEIRDVFYRAFKELDAFSVPGIGTFRKKRLSAKVEHLNKQVLPPTMGFVLEMDSIPVRSLEDYFFRNLEVSVAKATELVESVKKYFQNGTENGSGVEIPDVGTVVQNQGNFELVGNTGNTLQHPEFFGLGPVNFTLGSREVAVKPRTKEEAIASVFAAQGAKTEAPKPITRKRRSLALPMLLVLLVALGVSGFLFREELKGLFSGASTSVNGPIVSNDTTPKSGDSLLASNTPPTNNTPETNPDHVNSITPPATKENTVKNTPPEKVETKKEVQPKVVNNPKENVAPKTTPKVEKNPPVSKGTAIGIQPSAGTFYLVVASTMNPDEAKSLAGGQGVKTTLLEPYGGAGNGFYKVSVFESKDKSKVIQKMVEWKTKFSKSWIYWLGM